MKKSIINKPPRYLSSTWSLDGHIHRHLLSDNGNQPDKRSKNTQWPIDGRFNNRLLTEETIVRPDEDNKETNSPSMNQRRYALKWSSKDKIRKLSDNEDQEELEIDESDRSKVTWPSPTDGRFNNKLLGEDTTIVRSDAERVVITGLAKGTAKTNCKNPMKSSLNRSYSNVNRNSLPKHYSLCPENYVYIKDPIVKDLTIALINSEKERSAQRINSNKLTLIELGPNSLLFSKKGSDSVTNRKFTSSTDLFANPPPADNPMTRDGHYPSLPMATLTSNSELYSNKNLLLTCKDCNYYLMEIYNETTGICNDKPKTNDLTTETRRTILSDLRENPIEENGARSYKIFVYGNGINIRYKEQTLRILISRVSRDKYAKSVPFGLGGRELTKGLINRHTNASYKFLDLDEII